MRRRLEPKKLAGRSLRALGSLVLLGIIGCGADEPAPQAVPDNGPLAVPEAKAGSKAIPQTSKIQRPPE